MRLSARTTLFALDQTEVQTIHPDGLGLQRPDQLVVWLERVLVHSQGRSRLMSDYGDVAKGLGQIGFTEDSIAKATREINKRL